MRFHVLASLPRSGSTLLCNILRQNPRFHVSDTSPLGHVCAQVLAATVQRAEFTSMLGAGDAEALEAVRGGLRGLVHGWYAATGASVAFDKDRSNAWLFQYDALRDFSPSTKIICLVRDPREILASVLTRQEARPLIRDFPDPQARTLTARVGVLMSPQGMVGSGLAAIEALLGQRSDQSANVHLIKYEQLVADPRLVLRHIYEAIGEEPFDHDFTDVKNTSREQDHVYRNMWIHDGSGPVAPRPNRWPDVLPPPISAQIFRAHPLFYRKFGYSA